MNLNENKLYIKIVALDTIYSVVVKSFFYLKLFGVPKLCFKFLSNTTNTFQNNSNCNIFACAHEPPFLYGLTYLNSYTNSFILLLGFKKKRRRSHKFIGTNSLWMESHPSSQILKFWIHFFSHNLGCWHGICQSCSS